MKVECRQSLRNHKVAKAAETSQRMTGYVASKSCNLWRAARSQLRGARQLRCIQAVKDAQPVSGGAEEMASAKELAKQAKRALEAERLAVEKMQAQEGGQVPAQRWGGGS